MPKAEDDLEKALISVWRQSLVERKNETELGEQTYPVRRTPRKNLAQIDFTFDGREIRGLEQNPNTKSRWAKMAREGKSVMQFLEAGKYIANVAGGKVTWYGGGVTKSRSIHRS